VNFVRLIHGLGSPNLSFDCRISVIAPVLLKPHWQHLFRSFYPAPTWERQHLQVSRRMIDPEHFHCQAFSTAVKSIPHHHWPVLPESLRFCLFHPPALFHSAASPPFPPSERFPTGTDAVGLRYPPAGILNTQASATPPQEERSAHSVAGVRPEQVLFLTAAFRREE
jgi:hypothetical protein